MLAVREAVAQVSHRMQAVAKDCSEIPPLLNGATLHDYQRQSFRWMWQLYVNHASGILADEMGLGKTIQSLAFLNYLFHPSSSSSSLSSTSSSSSVERPKPISLALIVAPLSLLFNWESEIKKFVPLNSLLYMGDQSERAELRSTFEQKNVKLIQVLVTSPDLLLRDHEWISAFAWDFLIVDEAHRLKNRNSVLFTTLLTHFKIPNKLLLTGTPIQNTVNEFLALLYFCNPHLFEDIESIEQYFRKLDWQAIESAGSIAAASITDKLAQILKEISRPFMLRRMKAQVLPYTIPPKREHVIFTRLADMQRRFYQSLLKTNKVLLNPNSLKGQSLQNIVIHLRKTCNHPYLFDDAKPTFDGEYVLGEHILENSSKLMFLDRLLAKLRVSGHRVLLYSQMTRMLDILQDYLTWRNYSYERLDGSTRAAERSASVQRFTGDEECFVFLLSSRAGGQGLNLVAADVVIFYDLDWNPSIDQQAEARVHRIGQTKEVLVIKLVCKDTVEEFIQRRSAGKSRLQQTLLDQPNVVASQSSAPTEVSVLTDAIQFGMHNLLKAESSQDLDYDLDEIIDGRHRYDDHDHDHDETLQQPQSLERAATASQSSLSAIDYYNYEGCDYREEKKKADTEALTNLLGPIEPLTSAGANLLLSEDDLSLIS